jgi:formate dehydrogenase (coenzyme F420) beta subunit
MKEKVKAWLQEGRIDIFLGYRMMKGHPLPYAFVKDRLPEVDDLISGSTRYPLEKLAAKIAAEQPGIRIGMLARDCNKRALKVLSIWNQLGPETVETLDVNCCPSNLKDGAECSYLKPPKSGCHKKQVGIDNQQDPEDFENYDQQERFTRWMNEFQRCIKCYGCRNICPVCFCRECSLEHPDLIQTGDFPPEVPIFHLVRAVHMAGRCIDCGLCEEACPVDIPLRLLYRKVNQIVSDIFDYRPGSVPAQSPLSVLGEKADVDLLPLKAAER